MHNVNGFRSCANKGFQITVNGFTLSVQFGASNYCERRDYGVEYGAEKSMDNVESPDAEIGIWPVGGELLKISEYDTVRGWVRPRTVARIMGFLANVTPGDCDAVIAFVRSLDDSDEELIAEVVDVPVIAAKRLGTDALLLAAGEGQALGECDEDS